VKGGEDSHLGAAALLYRVQRDGGSDICHQPADGSGPAELLQPDTSHALVTPDEPFPAPGPKYVVSAGEGEHRLWAPDGRTLYYSYGVNMYAADVELEPACRFGAGCCSAAGAACGFGAVAVLPRLGSCTGRLSFSLHARAARPGASRCDPRLG
jgi:hypothetical protein